MSTMGQRKQVAGNEAGLVSIMVTMILMIVVGLIVIGFGTLARHNQREAQDRQQGTQAYYAAETGVNQVGAKLLAQLAAGTALPPTAATDCQAFLIATPSLNGGTIDATSKVGYTCALVDDQPTSLNVTSGAIGSNTVLPLNLSGNLKTLKIEWAADTGGGTNVASCHPAGLKLPANTAWGCDYALMRLDIVQVPGGLDAGSLASSTKTYYFLPSVAASATPNMSSFSDAATRANLVAVACAAGKCTANLNACPGGGGGCAASSSNYYGRLTYVYKNAQGISMTGVATDGTAERFAGAQAVIDITGQAQDQLRRIQARIRLTASNDSSFPTGALESGASICKYFTIAPGDTTATYPDSSPACTYP